MRKRKNPKGIRKAYQFIILLILALLVILLYLMIRPPWVEKGTDSVKLSAWLVDWHWQSGIENAIEMAGGLSSVQVFGANFDHNDNLKLSEEITKGLPHLMELKDRGMVEELYLTIVNDRFDEAGRAVQKDTSLVSRLMANEMSRERHINEIMELVGQGDFQGVELDYEKIEPAVWENYISFYMALYDRLKEENKSLRIILEPGAPVDEMELPAGPVYVMMAYNLYGYHSGPGPKADYSLIKKLADKMESVPGDNYMALATGGFAWGEDGKVTALTEGEARALSDRSLDEPQRDEASGSVYFEYLDERGIRRTVWYADEKTLDYWINTAIELGFPRIALWRLGDLQPPSTEYLKEIRSLN